MTRNRLSLPTFISSGMIIQQNQPFILRGEVTPHAYVSVSMSRSPADSSRPVSPLDPDYGTLFESGITADGSGEFEIELPPLSASFDPLSLCITSGTSRVDVTDILAGEVWLAVGGENMAFPVRAVANSRQLLEQANTPYVRFLYPDPSVRADIPLSPAKDLAGGTWIYGDDHASMANRSAIAFSFARELCQELHLPIAIIDLAIRDARLHALLPRTAVSENEHLRAYVESINLMRDETNWNLLGELNIHQPGAIFNTRLAPLAGLSVQGILWLHGESDFVQSNLYADCFRSLMDELHRLLKPAKGDRLNLIYAQLPPFYTGREKDRYLARFNEMLASLRQSLPGPAGLVTLYDLPPDYKDAPEPFNQPKTPWTKQPVGHRMKQVACGLVYQRKAPESSPECAEYEVVGNKLLISFSHIVDGLRLTGDDNRLRGFTICGRDRVFVEASARLLYGVRVLVWHDQITGPVAVTYAYQDLNMSANLISRDGFPVVPFRSDRVVSRSAGELEWLHCEHLKIWAVSNQDPTEGPAYHPVYQLTRGQGTLLVERTNKNEGDGALHLRYETDPQKQIGISPILTYPSLYPPLDLSLYSGLAVDVFNPDMQFKSLSIELGSDLKPGRPDQPGKAPGEADPVTELAGEASPAPGTVIGPLPIEPALRWQTLEFRFESLPADQRQVRSITFVLTDRKGKGQVFMDRIRLLLPE